MAAISTKELNYVKDFLSWELYMAKICRQYADQVTDQNFNRIMDKAGQVHQQNYDEMFQFLGQVK